MKLLLLMTLDIYANVSGAHKLIYARSYHEDQVLGLYVHKSKAAILPPPSKKDYHLFPKTEKITIKRKSEKFLPTSTSLPKPNLSIG